MSDRHPYYAAIGGAIEADSGDPSLTKLTHGRIYPDQLPNDSKLPAVRYAIVSNAPHHRFSSGDNVTATVQFDVYADRKCQGDAWGIDKAIRRVMDRAKMEAEGFSQIHSIADQRGRPFAEPGVYRVMSTYRLAGSAS